MGRRAGRPPRPGRPVSGFASPLRALGRVGSASVPALLSLVDQGLVSGFGFLSGLTTARLVGVSTFGRFAIVMVFLTLAQGVHNALITAPMMTLIGSRARPSRAYHASLLAAAALLSLATGTVVAGLIGCFFAVRGDELSPGLLVATALVGTTQNLQFTLRRLLFACGQGGRAVAMDLARLVAFPALAVALHQRSGGLTVTAVMLILAATALLTSLPALWSLRPRRRRMIALRAVAGRHAGLARWLLPVVLVTFGQEQLVWILAGGLLGDHAMGGLRAAQYVVGLVLLLLAATENIVPVGAAQALAEGGRPALNRYLVVTGTRLGLLVAAVLLALAVPAGFWLTLIFGEAFAPFANCLRVLAVTALLVHVRDMAAHLFRATRRTGVVFSAFAVSLALSLLCAYPLLSRGGLIGAALVVLVGQAGSMVYLLAAAAGYDPKIRVPTGWKAALGLAGPR